MKLVQIASDEPTPVQLHQLLPCYFVLWFYNSFVLIYSISVDKCDVDFSEGGHCHVDLLGTEQKSKLPNHFSGYIIPCLHSDRI